MGWGEKRVVVIRKKKRIKKNSAKFICRSTAGTKTHQLGLLAVTDKRYSILNKKIHTKKRKFEERKMN